MTGTLTNRSLLAWLPFLLALCGPVTARADEAAMQRAKAEYSRGQTLFGQGDFEAAREAFTASLTAFPHYRTIFNIALCEEKLGRIAAAVAMYHRYLDWLSPVPNEAEVRVKLAELERQLPAAPPHPAPPPAAPPPAAAPPPTPTTPAATGPAPAPPPPPTTPPPDLVTPGWITLGAGVLFAVTGGVFTGLAVSRADAMDAAAGETYDPDTHDALAAEGRTFEIVGWTGLGLGVAGLATGATLLLLSTGDDPASTRGTTVTATSRGLRAGWSF